MRILCLDLETAPLLGYAWQAYEANIIEVLEPVKIMVVGWSWLDEENIQSVGLCDARSEKDLVELTWELLDAADVVVAHNGDKFDLRVANSRFLHYGMKPTKPYKTVDTLKIARKHFRLESNKLNDLARYLGVGEKIAHTGWALWKSCLEGDQTAWKMLKEYNTRDVKLLKDVYKILRPWATSHPNLTALGKITGEQCPNCQSFNVQRRGFSVLKKRVKQRYQCQACGSWFKGPYASKEELSEVKT